MLEEGTIDVVVGRITIDEAIKKQGIEGKAPVLGRRRKLVTSPFPGIFQRMLSILISV